MNKILLDLAQEISISQIKLAINILELSSEYGKDPLIMLKKHLKKLQENK